MSQDHKNWIRLYVRFFSPCTVCLSYFESITDHPSAKGWSVNLCCNTMTEKISPKKANAKGSNTRARLSILHAMALLHSHFFFNAFSCSLFLHRGSCKKTCILLKYLYKQQVIHSYFDQVYHNTVFCQYSQDEDEANCRPDVRSLPVRCLGGVVKECVLTWDHGQEQGHGHACSARNLKCHSFVYQHCFLNYP